MASPGKRTAVLGPIAIAVIVVALLATSILYKRLGDDVTAGMIVAAVLARLVTLIPIPIATGRPGDVVKVVTRGAGSPRTRTPVDGVPLELPRETTARGRRATPPPLPPPPLGEEP